MLDVAPGFSEGLHGWQPVLEYNGPDFGFDADQLDVCGGWGLPLVQNLNPDSSLLLNNAGFDAYVQQFGDRLNF